MFKKLLRLDSSPKKSSKSLTIHLETDNVVRGQNQQLSSQSLAIVQGSQELPGYIQATVTFETANECVGDEVEIVFKAVVGSKTPGVATSVPDGLQMEQMCTLHISEHIIQKRRWLLPLETTGPHKIAPGKYVRKVYAVIDPSWPSSCTHAGGFVRYSFHAQLSKVVSASNISINTNNNNNHTAPPSKFSSSILKTSKEFLVANYNLPMTPNLPPELTPPFTVKALWKKKSLPVELSIPSENVTLGQTIPLTMHMRPIKEGTYCYGQGIHVLESRFMIYELRHIRTTLGGLNTKVVKVPVDLTVAGVASMAPWPQSAEGWTRTVDVVIPLPSQCFGSGSHLSLTPSMKSKYYDISHQLVVSMKIRTSGERDRQAEENETQLEIQLMPPKPDVGSLPPMYNGSTAGAYTDHIATAELISMGMNLDELPPSYEESQSRV
ncbi:hypothetical protein BG011_004928 [Mortierella polycephala]|uniref:Uncharacterized protein n=1 Tax=Mortierella polycephala TaxID=41804 RepID=A0A9P6U218_9FUNG|nr:hypothetical protein BG011_004928 [Mortierella polycephala]